MTCSDNTRRLPFSPPPDRIPARRFLAVDRGNGMVSIFDPWIEGARIWTSPTAVNTDRLVTIRGWSKDSRENTDPLIGETLELVVAAAGDGIRDLDHVARSPLCQFGVFNHRPDVTESLEAAGPALRAAVFEALVGGVTGDDGWMRAKIGDAEVAVEPMSGAWSVENADGRRREHLNAWNFSFALGAVPTGVFAVRLLEAFFRRKMPAAVALAVSDAIHDWGPTPKEVLP